MLSLLKASAGAFLSAFRSKGGLIAENLVLRQQLAVLRRSVPRPRIRPVERALWVVLSHLWSRWREVLVIVHPATVIAWHRKGFALFWRWKSRAPGRPPVSAEIIALIERMARENPLWTRRRISSELAKLGYVVDKQTVAKYMPAVSPTSRPPRLQTWKTFLHNHTAGTIAIDFLTVPTVTFRSLYVFFVLSLDRRRILHVNVTANPSAQWAGQQIIESVGYDAPPRFLMRDRDGIFAAAFDKRVESLGIEQLKSAPRSPWQNGYAERWVGSLRRELLDHVVVLGERHLLHMVRQYVAYYNEDRPHMALGSDAPVSRAVEAGDADKVIALPRVGGLHHRYARAA